MEPIPTLAVAVQWEFRCHGRERPEGAWDWQCRSKEGSILARSRKSFRSLQEALTDAQEHGFSVRIPPDGR
jgi:hypothetical protein